MNQSKQRSHDTRRSLCPRADELLGLLRKGAPGLLAVGAIDREPCSTTSRASAEILTVQRSGGRLKRVWAKHGLNKNPSPHESWRGVAYEAAVHEFVLPRLTTDAPGFVGACLGFDAHTAHLFLELVIAAPDSPSPGAVEQVQAARWLGEFHRAGERAIAGGELPMLQAYTGDRFERAIDYLRAYHRRTRAGRPWLPALLQRETSFSNALIGCAPVAIHGRFRMNRLVFEGTRVRPRDWECAGRGAGELDLARLMADVSAAVRDECLAAYRTARWPDGIPGDHGARLRAARLHHLLCHIAHRQLLDRSRQPLESLRGFVEQGGLP